MELNIGIDREGVRVRFTPRASCFHADFITYYALAIIPSRIGINLHDTRKHYDHAFSIGGVLFALHKSSPQKLQDALDKLRRCGVKTTSMGLDIQEKEERAATNDKLHDV